MIKVNGATIALDHRFPDGTFAFLADVPWTYERMSNQIFWKYQSESELVALIYLTKKLHERYPTYPLYLDMPYIPNARMDRVKSPDEVFTLKYFAEVINSLGFQEVRVLDPHSSVATALLDRVVVRSPVNYLLEAYNRIGFNPQTARAFYPDEGAAKRYSDLIRVPYSFGIKHRDWATGQIRSLQIAGDIDLKDKDILIIDDICSRGGTAMRSAKALKEAGARRVFCFFTHCEDTIFAGDIPSSDLIDRVFTTNSVFTKEIGLPSKFTVFAVEKNGSMNDEHSPVFEVTKERG